MESPEESAAAHVIPAHILGQAPLPEHPRIAGSIDHASDDDHVVHHDGPRAPIERPRRRRDQVHPSLLAETGDRLAGGRVEGIEIPAPHQDQTTVRAGGPIVHPPVTLAGGLLERLGKRLLDPQELTGPRIEGLRQAHTVWGIEHAIDEDRCRPQIPGDHQIWEGFRQ